MVTSVDPPITNFFPNLAREGYAQTSCKSEDYNCIAWAVHDQENWWWPTSHYNGKAAYWPRYAPKKVTINAFTKALESRGYKRFPGNDGLYESGYEKIAIFALGQTPTHAARQLPDGQWTHKMGKAIDLTASLKAVEGPEYGQVVRFLRKKLG
jgi:hypothetical protein